jgi:hypothetical protein
MARSCFTSHLLYNSYLGNPLVAIGPKVAREVKLRWSGFTSHLPAMNDYVTNRQPPSFGNDGSGRS